MKKFAPLTPHDALRVSSQSLGTRETLTIQVEGENAVAQMRALLQQASNTQWGELPPQWQHILSLATNAPSQQVSSIRPQAQQPLLVPVDSPEGMAALREIFGGEGSPAAEKQIVRCTSHWFDPNQSPALLAWERGVGPELSALTSGQPEVGMVYSFKESGIKVVVVHKDAEYVYVEDSTGRRAKTNQWDWPGIELVIGEAFAEFREAHFKMAFATLTERGHEIAVEYAEA